MADMADSDPIGPLVGLYTAREAAKWSQWRGNRTMARTRTRRLRWTGVLTAAACAAALSAVTLPAHAAPEGQILGAGEPGSVSGSYLVTLKGGTKAPSATGKGIAEKYGAKISHTYGSVLNGYAIKADERQAKLL